MPAKPPVNSGHRLLLAIMLIAFIAGIVIFSATSPTGIQINGPGVTISVTHSPASPQTGQLVTITATVTGTVPISVISLFVDDILVKSCSVSPCVYTATYTSAGTHTYYATATDTSGVSLAETGLVSGKYE